MEHLKKKAIRNRLCSMRDTGAYLLPIRPSEGALVHNSLRLVLRNYSESFAEVGRVASVL
jgi:hypothetical protein